MHSADRLGSPREIIRRLRAAKGFTSDRALAIAAGVSQPTLSRYLAGKTESLGVENFRALADMLDVTLSELLGEVPISTGGRLKELVRLMDQLPEPERAALLAAGRAMVSATSSKKPS